jgi:hypothetical protein
MVLDIDGFAVFRSIGAHPRAFASIATEVAKVARGLVVKQINAKTSDLKSVRNICAAIGRDSFDLILDGLTDGQVKSLVAKVDKHHPETKGGSPEWRLQRIRALAHGIAEPIAKPTTAVKSKKLNKRLAERPAAPERLAYLSAGAKRKR